MKEIKHIEFKKIDKIPLEPIDDSDFYSSIFVEAFLFRVCVRVVHELKLKCLPIQLHDRFAKGLSAQEIINELKIKCSPTELNDSFIKNFNAEMDETKRINNDKQ